MITREDVLNYAEAHGAEGAHDLLLLAGPDGFDGGYTEYCDLIDGYAAKIAYSAGRV